ncbi:GerMN domain-containing protein [Granulicella sp. S190]|uniref:GerMN domain-containing protein n=1 Tax=Granulicella sp. S190 TaxID=1747226 RepID=UPI00131ACA09|nr:GerMN domain-containing protein [Granulicella sp. S190]
MIPRYQRILFWSLLGGIFLMSAFLLHGCQQAHKRLASLNDATPISAPTATSSEDVTFYLANDSDASITPTTESLALPQAPTLRARTLLEHLLAAYALPNSNHPLQSGPSIDDLFLLDTPADSNSQGGQLAVVNLHGSFVDNHPSGIQVEALTLQSLIGTLHAALPQVTGIRFLVDGQPHDTLAGHADLLRTYPATDTTSHPAPPTEAPPL